MATRKKPLHWYYALFLPRSRSAAWRMPYNLSKYGLRAPIQESSNLRARAAYRAERDNLTSDAELILFKDLTGTPPAFLSDLELATIAENLQRRFSTTEAPSWVQTWNYHRRVAHASVHPVTGECFFPSTTRNGGGRTALPGTELIAKLDATELRQRRLRDDVWASDPKISDVRLVLHNGHILQKI